LPADRFVRFGPHRGIGDLQGRKAGSGAMTGTAMTRAETSDLLRLVRQRERLAKTSAAQRSAELLADFEKQLGSTYSYDTDETWRAAAEAASKAVPDAQAAIAERCRELGIPKEFAPGVTFGWYGRGQNASAKRRAELRAMATSRIAAIEKAARTEIERMSLNAQTAIVAHGLQSDAAKAFLEKLPPIAELMPTIGVKSIEEMLGTGGQP
jgi:hypothetical protein